MNYPLNIRRNEWESLNEKDQFNLRQDIISYFRENGFPHFKYSVEEQHKELERLDKYMKNNDLEKDGIIRQTMHGVGVCWSYHPHHWSIRCGTSKTPMEVFKDDRLLDKTIKKRMSGGSHINEAMIRKTLKVSGGAQSVSNFRPSVARWIYDKYAGEGVVYDPCAGFGGRLFGAISSPRVKSYHGVDPSSKTFEGLQKMAMNLGEDTEINLHKQCAENVVLSNKVDLSFTSPPYFDTEKYSDEETQSWVRYKTYDDWFTEFLMTMLENSISILKEHGYLIINIANVKTAPHLENDFEEIMHNYSEVIPISKYKMALSLQHSGGKFKYEPIYVFQKV